MQNPVQPALGLHKGGSIINVASFVALMGAATPQLACERFKRSSILHWKHEGRLARADAKTPPQRVLF